SSFEIGWSQVVGVNSFVVVNRYDITGAPLGSANTLTTPNAGQSFHLARFGAASQAAWIEAASDGGYLLEASTSLSSAFTLVGPTSQPINALDLAPGDAGVVVTWTQGLATQTLHAR